MATLTNQNYMQQLRNCTPKSENSHSQLSILLTYKSFAKHCTTTHLVNEQLKVDTARPVVLVVVDVACPRLAPDHDDVPVAWECKLDHDQRRPVALLHCVWVELDGKTRLGVVLQRSNVLLVHWCLCNTPELKTMFNARARHYNPH